MDQVQGGLSAGSNGKEKSGGGIHPYMNDGSDPPGVEVQGNKYDQNYDDMIKKSGDRQAHNLPSPLVQGSNSYPRGYELGS
jgi:hypothetical protein